VEVTGSKRVKWIRRALKAVAVVALALVAYLVLAPTGRYLLRGAWEEAKILAKRRPLADILADSATSPALRAKLELVLAARAFARDSLDLDVGESFSTYSETGRDTLTLLVSGAYRDRLKSYTWWFPIVGRVPYKGYFDFDEARRQERALNARGFDTRLGAVSAFSTLGWFNDPLLPSTLRADSLQLANTVIHELTHNTYYAPGGAVFNESFANFVGYRGAEQFFRARGQAAAAAEVNARWKDEIVIGRFWATLYARVDSAFKAHPGEDAKAVAARLAARGVLFTEARDSLVHAIAPKLKTISIRSVERVKLDNAVLMSRRVYQTDLDMFDAVLSKNRWDLRRTVAEIIAAAKADPEEKPFEVLRRMAVGSPALSPSTRTVPASAPADPRQVP
jgi:predicted aminopeptidase